MTLTGTEARYQLSAAANLTSVNTSGSATLGTTLATVTYSTAPDIAYSLAMFITSGETLTLNLATAAVTGGVTGTNQVETATVVAGSGITSNGTCSVIFTAADVTGSPLTVPVALTTTQTTATLIAVEIRSALTATAAIAAEYTIGGTGATVTATRIKKRSNDATLNINIPAGLGITAAATSANTTAGVGEAKAWRLDGTAWGATDHEGKAIPAATKLYGILVRIDSTSVGYVTATGSDQTLLLDTDEVNLSTSKVGDHTWNTNAVTFTPTGGDALIYIDIHAGT